jgi:hypothetical protein
VGPTRHAPSRPHFVLDLVNSQTEMQADPGLAATAPIHNPHGAYGFPVEARSPCHREADTSIEPGEARGPVGADLSGMEDHCCIDDDFRVVPDPANDGLLSDIGAHSMPSVVGRGGVN